MKCFLLGMLLLGAGTSMQAATFSNEQHHAQIMVGDSITLDYLVGMDKKKFKGKTVADFLESPEAKGYQDVQFRHTPEGVLEGVKIKYSSNLYLNVYVRDFQFLEPKNEKKSWSMDILKKEKIDEIRVVYVMHEGR